MMHAATPDRELLARFATLFDRGAFRAALDPVEDLWFRHRDPFYKGLVQLTVVLNQLTGYGLTEGLLATRAPTYLGMDVAQLLAYCEAWRRRTWLPSRAASRPRPHSAGPPRRRGNPC